MKDEKSGLSERMADFAFEVVKTEKIATKDAPKNKEKK
jgi:hypothetical protein